MKTLTCLLCLLLMTSCTRTTLTGSWKDPGFTGPMTRVYVIGVAKQELHRRLLEEAFVNQLLTYGVTGLPSYRDLPGPDQDRRTAIDARVAANRADTVLITRVLGQRTEQVVHPGHVTWRRWPTHGNDHYIPAPYYRHYWSYYDRRYDMIYTPATVSEYQVVTAECNLYNTTTGSLVWSAQFETILQNNFRKQITNFVEVVTRSLNEDGLL